MKQITRNNLNHPSSQTRPQILPAILAGGKALATVAVGISHYDAAELQGGQ